MSKSKSKPEAVRTIRAGTICELANQDLVEATESAAEGEFVGRRLTFNEATGRANRSKRTERFAVDAVARRMTKREFEAWIETGRREIEAIAEAARTRALDGAAAKPRTKSVQGAAKAAKKASKQRTRATSDVPTKRLSALDAAAEVLAKASAPMSSKELIDAMAAQGLWTSPGGATPWATLYAAVTREIARKGDASRFVKVDAGRFQRAR